MITTSQKYPIIVKGSSSRLEIHVILEEESQDESHEDSGKETKALVTIKKLGRKSGRRKREETTDKEKELGLQTTLDSTFKDSKGNIGPNNIAPSKGGL